MFGNARENLFHEIGIKTWVEEQPVDMLLPYTADKNIFSFELTWGAPRHVDYWVALAQKANCRSALNVMRRNLDLEEYLLKAKMRHPVDAEQLAFCDTAIAGDKAAETLRRLGN